MHPADKTREDGAVNKNAEAYLRNAKEGRQVSRSGRCEQRGLVRSLASSAAPKPSFLAGGLAVAVSGPLPNSFLSALALANCCLNGGDLTADFDPRSVAKRDPGFPRAVTAKGDSWLLPYSLLIRKAASPTSPSEFSGRGEIPHRR